MRVCYAIAVVVLLAITMTTAYAGVISVTPGSHPDWAVAKMGTSGTAMRGSAYQYWPAAGDFNTIGGAVNPYSASTGGSSKLGTVNYGTNLFGGRLLSEIEELSYTVYMHDYAALPGTIKALPNQHAEYGSGRAYGLELEAEKGDGNQRVMVYIAPTVAYNQWVTINPLTEGTWKSMNVNSGTLDHTWASLKASVLPTAKITSNALVAGETRSYGDAWKTVSGKSFNFVEGSRVVSMAGFGSWWNSWYNSSGYIGSLTIRFTGQAEATTYQFIPEPSSILALFTGVVGLLAVRRRR